MLRRLDSRAAEFRSQLQDLLAFETSQDPEVDARVAAILDDVKHRGDAALIEYTQRFDGVDASSMAQLEITQEQLQEAFERLLPQQKKTRCKRPPPGCAVITNIKKSQLMAIHRRRRHAAGAAGDAAGSRRHLCAGRQGFLSVLGADERHPRACGRCARNHHGGAHSARRTQ